MMSGHDKAGASNVIFLDFEASALGPRGYPIEVGWALVNPPGQVMVRSMLIRPAEAWADWDWSSQSAAVHNIAREELMRDGLPVGMVAQVMNRELAGQVVHSDHPRGDGFWLHVLFDAAGMVPTFRLKDIASAFERVSDLAYERAVERGNHPPVTHRAGDDALHWARKYMAAAAWDRGER